MISVSMSVVIKLFRKENLLKMVCTIVNKGASSISLTGEGIGLKKGDWIILKKKAYTLWRNYQ